MGKTKKMLTVAIQVIANHAGSTCEEVERALEFAATHDVPEPPARKPSPPLVYLEDYAGQVH
jgi:hypothetical protein